MDPTSPATKSSLPLELWELIFPTMMENVATLDLDYYYERRIGLSEHPAHKAIRNDWLVANLVRRAWRPYNRRVFFERKRFVIRPVFVEHLAKGHCRPFDRTFGLDAMRYIRHIIAPIPDFSLIYNTLAVAQYQHFQGLERLTFALMARTAGVERGEQFFEVPEQIVELFERLGLDLARLRRADAIFRDAIDAKYRVRDFRMTIHLRLYGWEGHPPACVDMRSPEPPDIRIIPTRPGTWGERA